MNKNARVPNSVDLAATVAETDTVARSDSTGRHRLLVTALCVSVSLSFYVLSAGPMSGLSRKLELRSFRNAVEWAYKPLVIIVKKDVRPFSTVLRWYAGLFR